MNTRLLCLALIVLISACSTPKYSYYFDHHKYPVPKTAAAKPAEEKVLPASDQEPALVHEVSATSAAEIKQDAGPRELTRSEKRIFIKEHKTEILQIWKEVKKGTLSPLLAPATKATKMDGDLKMAVIFGVVGLVFFLIGSQVFNVLGAVAFIIGLVFFIKWIIRQ